MNLTYVVIFDGSALVMHWRRKFMFVESVVLFARTIVFSYRYCRDVISSSVLSIADNVSQLHNYILGRRIYFIYQLCPLIVLSWTSFEWIIITSRIALLPFIKCFVNFCLFCRLFSLSRQEDLSRKKERRRERNVDRKIRDFQVRRTNY